MLPAEPVPSRPRRLPTARGLLAWIPGIPGFVGLWLYLLDDDMPLKHRLSIFFSIVYLIMPADFLPEMLLGPLGLVDDAAVLSGLIAFAASATMRSFRAQARKLLRGELDDQPD